MITIREIKLRPEENKERLYKKTAAILGVKPEKIEKLKIVRESIDARKKPDVFFVYEVSVKLKNIDSASEEDFIKKNRIKNVQIDEEKHYVFPYKCSDTQDRPVIVGMGPAGLFCALVLARAGFRPIILERGKDVEERIRDVEDFWNGKTLNSESNVSFGEGGAGTFSDGKLNTLVKGSKDIHRFVLEEFVNFGANPEILYSSKPHIGTDVLAQIVKKMRTEIILLGGEVHFNSCARKFVSQDGCLSGVVYTEAGELKSISCRHLCLACGHSARDTFKELYSEGIKMEPKPFAVGVRIEHPQSMINESQYGSGYDENVLPAASYKLTTKTDNNRSVYSFCMCPGGYVVNASSEQGKLVVNGMSYSGRKGENANSAIVVAVSPDDFDDENLFAGMIFQQELEKKAFNLANGRIPLQKYEDFVNNTITSKLGDIQPNVKGSWQYANLRPLFPEFINNALLCAIPVFGKKIHGFDRGDSILLGVETRTSSPLRIVRDEKYQSSLKGLYPCGEGAGYAGGITSAAMDGIRIAEAIAGHISLNNKKNDD